MSALKKDDPDNSDPVNVLDTFQAIKRALDEHETQVNARIDGLIKRRWSMNVQLKKLLDASKKDLVTEKNYSSLLKAKIDNAERQLAQAQARAVQPAPVVVNAAPAPAALPAAGPLSSDRRRLCGFTGANLSAGQLKAAEQREAATLRLANEILTTDPVPASEPVSLEDVALWPTYAFRTDGEIELNIKSKLHDTREWEIRPSTWLAIEEMARRIVNKTVDVNSFVQTDIGCPADLVRYLQHHFPCLRNSDRWPGTDLHWQACGVLKAKIKNLVYRTPKKGAKNVPAQDEAPVLEEPVASGSGSRKRRARASSPPELGLPILRRNQNRDPN